MFHHFRTVLPYGQTQTKGNGRDRNPSASDGWSHIVFRIQEQLTYALSPYKMIAVEFKRA
jgi:hypothetical protein